MDTVNKYVLLMHIFHLLSSNQMKTKTDAALTSCFRFDSLDSFHFCHSRRSSLPSSLTEVKTGRYIQLKVVLLKEILQLTVRREGSLTLG